MKKIGREVGLLLVLAAVLFGPTLMAGQGRAAQPRAGGLPDLVGALKATPGCLGVETAQTSSGKQVIFAWFENKKAALNWYYSDMHQGVVSQFFPGAPPSRKPLADVTDADGPVMAIASLTTAKPQAGVNASPFSQIAIELYRPLPGGIELGGRFAPAALKVPGLQVIPARTPPAAPEDTIVPTSLSVSPAARRGWPRAWRHANAPSPPIPITPKRWCGTGLAWRSTPAWPSRRAT